MIPVYACTHAHLYYLDIKLLACVYLDIKLLAYYKSLCCGVLLNFTINTVPYN